MKTMLILAAALALAGTAHAQNNRGTGLYGGSSNTGIYGGNSGGGYTAPSGGYSGGYSGSTGSHDVSGYTRSNGTYVQPSHATNPNNSKMDNWSTQGNVNPYTGKPGTRSPY